MWILCLDDWSSSNQKISQHLPHNQTNKLCHQRNVDITKFYKNYTHLAIAFSKNPPKKSAERSVISGVVSYTYLILRSWCFLFLSAAFTPTERLKWVILTFTLFNLEKLFDVHTSETLFSWWVTWKIQNFIFLHRQMLQPPKLVG